MRGLALETVASWLIAISAVLVVLSLLLLFKDASRFVYCKLLFNVIKVFDKSATLPAYCNVGKNLKEVSISDSSNELVARQLAAYIIACWKESELTGLNKERNCYGIYFENPVANVCEANVTKIIEEEDGCRSIENSDYGCGASNNIIWVVEGKIVKLTKDDLADALNYSANVSLPQNFVNSLEVPPAGMKSELKEYLTDTLPSRVCNAIGCKWRYDSKKDLLYFDMQPAIRIDVNLVLSYLEKIGDIDSCLNQQKVVLLRYDPAKSAVEVIA